jgi:hypothetical protein
MLDATKVTRVYSGKPGCACGCKGSYSRNPKTIRLIVKKMNAIFAADPEQAQKTNERIARTDTRQYFAYLPGDTGADDE